jgi:hypothetical protein
LTWFEKSSGFCSVFAILPGVPEGESDKVRLGGILELQRPDFAVRELEEAG